MWDRIAAWTGRHRRGLGVLAGLWFWSGCAIYAGFVRLPDMPEAVGQA